MPQSIHDGDLVVTGTLSPRRFAPPASSIGGTAINSADPVPATKLEGEFNLSYSQDGAVVADTAYLRIIRGATADVVAVEACVTETIATGADRTVNVDLQKSTGAGAFATILTATIELDNASVLRTVSTGALTGGAALVDGDLLRLVVTVAGAAGNQAEGLLVTVTLREDASP